MGWNCDSWCTLWLSRIDLKTLACDCNTHELIDRSPYLAKLARGFSVILEKEKRKIC